MDKPLWRIYYGDGSTCDNTQASWECAGRDGVVAVVVVDDLYGRVVLNGRDYYYKALNGSETDLYCTNDLEPQSKLRGLRRLTPGCLDWAKLGVCVAQEDFKRILIAATKDPDFPKPVAPRRRADDGERKRGA